MQHRRHYLVSGRVQAVGYRAFVVRVALSVGVTGWVRNLDDGRVELEAQGAAECLAALEHSLATGPTHAEVVGVDVRESALRAAEPGFLVRT